ncbi:MAG: DUF1361 domain-containing protein [Spirochaetes bacterium]|nr:DUF1361 domain-containing protein [Spirochaetota bacterium]
MNVYLENCKIMGTNILFATFSLLISTLIFKRRYWNQTTIFKKFPLLIGLFFFYLFLPYGPYVLTDIIHLVRQIRDFRYFGLTENSIIVFLIPQYILFMFIGLSIYVIAFQELLHFLNSMGFSIFVIWLIKIINPIIMGIGIFLGRVRRYHSWDVIFNSDEIILATLKDFSNLHFIFFVLFNSLVIFIGFEILSIFYKSIFNNLFDMKKKESQYGQEHISG